MNQERRIPTSKQMNYPTIIFLQLNRVGKVMSQGLLIKNDVLKFQDSIDGVEALLIGYLEDKKNKDIKKFDEYKTELDTKNKEIEEETSDNILSMIKLLKEKFRLLNQLAYWAGLYSMYQDKTPTHGEEE